MMYVDTLKAGDFLRVSKVYVKSAGYIWATMWFVVEGEGDEAAFGTMFYGPKDAIVEDEIDGGDTFRRVPESRLPNYVCAALAKWRLTGEKTVAD